MRRKRGGGSQNLLLLLCCWRERGVGGEAWPNNKQPPLSDPIRFRVPSCHSLNKHNPTFLLDREESDDLGITCFVGTQHWKGRVGPRKRTACATPAHPHRERRERTLLVVQLKFVWSSSSSTPKQLYVVSCVGRPRYIDDVCVCVVLCV